MREKPRNRDISKKFSLDSASDSSVEGSEEKILEVRTYCFGESRSVRHMSYLESGQTSRATMALLALGGLLVFTAAIVFGVEAARIKRMNNHRDEVASFLKSRGLSERFVPRVEGRNSVGILSLAASVMGMTILVFGSARLREEKKSPHFTVGCNPASDLPVDSEWLPEKQYRFPLIRRSKNGYEFVFTPHMKGSVRLSGEEKISLDRLRESGKALNSPDYIGAFFMQLNGDEAGRIVMGETAVEFDFVAPGPAIVKKRSKGNSAFLYYLLSLAGHGLLLFLLLSLPDDSASMVTGEPSVEGRYKRLAVARLQDAMREKERELEEPVQERKENLESEDSEKTREKSRDRGDRRLRPSRSSNSDGPGVSTGTGSSRNAGITGVLGRMSGQALASVFGRDTAVSSDAENALSQLVGLDHGDRGFHGLVPDGGRSGNPAGIGGINLGTWGTDIGDGGGRDGRFGPSGPGGGYRIAKHKTSEPEVSTRGTARLVGEMDENLVRRVIRRRIAEIRYCYVAHGLTRNERLEGRVSVRFLIDGNGRVASAGIMDTGLNVPAVENCILATIRRWSFPRPPAGIVQVIYPFHFRPGS